jgi:hypothetical protein
MIVEIKPNFFADFDESDSEVRIWKGMPCLQEAIIVGYWNMEAKTLLYFTDLRQYESTTFKNVKTVLHLMHFLD